MTTGLNITSEIATLVLALTLIIFSFDPTNTKIAGSTSQMIQIISILSFTIAVIASGVNFVLNAISLIKGERKNTKVAPGQVNNALEMVGTTRRPFKGSASINKPCVAKVSKLRNFAEGKKISIAPMTLVAPKIEKPVMKKVQLKSMIELEAVSINDNEL